MPAATPGADGISRGPRRWARRGAAALAATGFVAGAGAAQAAPLPAAQTAQIEAIIDGPRYPNATWGISVTDRATGERVYYRGDLPELGVPGGGDLAGFGTTSPARGALRAKTGTRAYMAPGAPVGLLGARGLSGYLTGASGRELLVTVIVNDVAFTGLDSIIAVIEDQVRIVEAINEGT